MITITRADIPQIIIKEAQSLYSVISPMKISRGSNRKNIAACIFSCKDVMFLGMLMKTVDDL